MADTFDIGNVVRLTVTFTDTAGELIDPSAVQLNIRPYGGDISTYTWLGGDIIRASLGVFYYDYTPSQPGLYYYRFIGTGALVAAGDSSFSITSSPATGTWPTPSTC